VRFDSLTIEKYGVYGELRLPLHDSPGLVVIYGPNEAGKSTCLSAISDFLFGIEHNSKYGQIFGYPQMRLEAGLRLSNGQQLILRRRKGTGKTLTDVGGKAVDEAVLSSILGPTSRERFEALFGLGHRALRDGGDRLLQADGDIGRLIVEAGGGLRALVVTMEALGAEAEKLFAVRRSADRAFYQAYDAFDAADRASKADVKTREAYEQARKQVAAAGQEYEARKAEQKRLTEQMSREQRVERVVPSLVALDQVNGKIEPFADLPALRPDFATAVRGALSSRDAARAALEEAEKLRAGLELQTAALVVPIELIKAEAEIRDIVQKSVHVENERKSRPNRIVELAGQEAQLATLRESIGLTPDADLAPLLPKKSTLDSLQRLANRSIELRPRIEGLTEQVETDVDSLKSLGQRQAKRIEAGFDRPFGIATSELNLLPRLAEDLKTRTALCQRLRDEVDSRLRAIGFSTLEMLRGWRCPDAAAIQAELERRVVFDKELAKHFDAISLQTARRESALAEIGRLQAGGEVPTGAAIATARGVRQSAWAPIRGAYLVEAAEAAAQLPIVERMEAVSLFEQRTAEADRLADRKSVEAQRITDLAVAEKQSTEAAAAAHSTTAAIQETRARAEGLSREFAETWPDAIARAADLAQLKALVTERSEILKRAEEAMRLFEEAERLRADHDPRMELLVLAEKRLNVPPDPTAILPARIQIISREIGIHDESHASYRTEGAMIEQVNDQLRRKRENLASLQGAQAEWLTEWRWALRETGLQDDVSPERANEIVNEWSAARGILGGIKSTRKRLSQFEDDERELIALLEAVAARIAFALPADPVAAAKMLDERLDEARKTETQRTSLEPQLAQRTADRDAKVRALTAAEALLASLCAEAATGEAGALAVAGRHEQLMAATAERAQIAATLMRAGDTRPTDVLRTEWGGRDLDGIRAEIDQIRRDLERIGETTEAGYADLQDRRRDLSAFESDAGMNALVAERERAAAEMRQVIDRYMEVTLARALLDEAVRNLRNEQQNPLLSRAGALFALTTRGAFSGIGADIDEKGVPVVIGKRASGGDVGIGQMSDGTRDQLFLAFRLASVENYCAAAEPLPFIADDLLVHFDDERSAATLELLAEVGKRTQVLLFTHHRSVGDMAKTLVDEGKAALIDLA
jgi:uncharacterized protein YhaN